MSSPDSERGDEYRAGQQLGRRVGHEAAADADQQDGGVDRTDLAAAHRQSAHQLRMDWGSAGAASCSRFSFPSP